VDKTVYVVLGSLSVAIFILTAVANVASSKPVSSVSLYLRCVALCCLPCVPHPRHAVPCRASWRSLVDRSGLSRGARACRCHSPFEKSSRTPQCSSATSGTPRCTA
jgi:hypothetical protein